MKNTIIGGCFALLAAVLAVFLAHHLTKENIDIRYTISDSIPANFLGTGSSRNIQQLDIVNRGDKTAEKIRIKLDKNITQYELTKYSEIDKIEENLSDKSLEILYPELPPEGKIKLVFSSEHSSLDKRNVDINHSKGIGQEAFDKKNSFFFSSLFLLLIYVTLFIIFITIEIFAFRNRWFERDAFKGCSSIFTKKNVPLFISVDRWNKLRNEAIISHIDNSSLSLYDIEDSTVVNFLNSDKPDYLNDDEWALLLRKAQNIFNEKMPSLIDYSFFYGINVEKFYKINKPKHFPQNKWDKILQNIQTKHILSLKEQGLTFKRFEDAKDIYKKINQENEYNIPVEYWDDYLKTLKKIYVFHLVKGLFSQYGNFSSYLNDHDTTIIDESERNILKEISYKLQYYTTISSYFTLETAQKFQKEDKPIWLKDKDYEKLKIIAQEVITFHEEKSKQNTFTNLLTRIRSKQTLPEKMPSELTENEWKDIKNLEEDLVGLLTKNQEILTEIKQKEKTIPTLIDKLEKQLTTINDFLSDPTVLDRIEDYNNTFSSGNFQNLKKIASLLTQTTRDKIITKNE